MKTRENFIYWVFKSKAFQSSNIDKKRFYNVQEKDYVFNTLSQLAIESESFDKIIQDYIHLEKQRYHIYENHNIHLDNYSENAKYAMLFCAKPEAEKRKSFFMMNPNLTDFLAHSSYAWDNNEKEKLEIENKHYLFIPSYLSIAMKEIHISGLNALLLDLINYQEVFSYQEFFELVSSSIDLPKKELDQMLIDFISDQMLYYQTFYLVDS